MKKISYSVGYVFGYSIGLVGGWLVLIDLYVRLYFLKVKYHMGLIG